MDGTMASDLGVPDISCVEQELDTLRRSEDVQMFGPQLRPALAVDHRLGGDMILVGLAGLALHHLQIEE